MSEPTASQRAACSVALVTMPFVSIYRPSLQLGLLKSLAVGTGFAAETFHFNLDFAQAIGRRVYEQMVHHRGRMFGDWLFSVAAFGDEAPDPDGAMLDRWSDEVAHLLSDVELTHSQLMEIRNDAVPAFVEAMVKAVDWGRFQVVGFTSTFQQNAASFALARRIKMRWPSTLILFGGANFEGEMGRELACRLEFIDYAIDGEADEAFPEFLKAVAAGHDPALVPGVVSGRHPFPGSPGGAGRERTPFERLDSLPTPDYGEYFDRALEFGVISEASRRLVYLPFESSRGCWWGQKHHCTFCGLNGSTIGFRSKSPARVREELASLAKSYGSFRFEAVDNIMDMKYFSDLLPALRADGSDYEFFYEIKSNLTRDKVKALRDAGVVRVQPGIESLDSRVLKLMRKGVTGLQNINLLRWSLHYGIDVGWNIIWGFPGEEAGFYADQLDTMRKLRHLQPPTGAGRIWMERFSPLFSDRESFKAQFVRPEESYSYVYPDRFDLSHVAYFFDYQMVDSLPDDVYRATRDEVQAWQAAWRQSPKPTLLFWSSPNQIQIEDFRDHENRGLYKFYDDLAAIYRVCSNRPISVAQVKKTLSLGRPVEEIEDALARFEQLGLMAREDDTFLSLALPASRSR